MTGNLVRAQYGTLAGEQVGTFAISQGTLTETDSSNYTSTFVPANLTITPAALTITANAQTKTYGTTDPTLTYSTSGLVTTTVDGVTLDDSAVMTGSLARAQYGTLPGEQVGTFAISQGTVTETDSSNYTSTFVPANETITPAALTITANAQTKTYGTTDPTLN